MLRRTCAALLASTLIAVPVQARDKTLYVGVEAGLLKAQDLEADVIFDNSEASFGDDFATIDHNLGFDAGLIFGYDAGLVRAELDLSYKRASHDEYELDFGEEGITAFNGDGSSRYIAIMANLLLDVGNEDGLSFYAGPGIGFAWGKFDLDDTGFPLGGIDDDDVTDGGVAWQLIAGLRYAVSPNVDVGVKYRYFRPSKITEDLDLFGDEESDARLRGRFRSHSLLATLTYNFYTPEPPPPPPPPEPERG